MNSHTPTPWKACKDHEDFDGPYFDIDPEDEELYAKRPYVRICSKSGTVTTNHDFDEFKPGDAEFIIKSCNEYEELAAIKETVAETLAMLRAPGFDNDGGPSDIANEVRVLLDNLNGYTALQVAHQEAIDKLKPLIESSSSDMSTIDTLKRFTKIFDVLFDALNP